jgi:hypothetical protein
VFASLFLLFVGVLMVGGTLHGLRRGRVMTLARSTLRAQERWARRGEPGYWLHVAFWIGLGCVVLYNGVRLL